jgi:hypothetical protein
MRAEKIGDFLQKGEGLVEVEEGDNMNPKEKFLEEFIALVGKFENETGVEIDNIRFERINTSTRGTITEETRIRNEVK